VLRSGGIEANATSGEGAPIMLYCA
jgi:hypothetical protein